MPDPIRSTSPSPLPSHHDPESVDPSLGGNSSTASQARSQATQAANKAPAPSPEQAPQQCREPSKLTPAVQALVTRNTRPNPTAEFVQNQKQAADTTAERTAATPLSGKPYYDRGATSDSEYVTAGLLYGRDPQSGVVEEFGTVSLQKGAQNEAQLTGVRMSMQNEDGDALGAELLTAQAGYGSHNKDGSTGFNLGGGVTLAGAEATLNLGGGNSVTAGAAVSASGEVSVGTRDSDHDGKQEVCARVGVPTLPFTFGACVETAPTPALGWLNSSFGGGPATFATPPSVPTAPSTARK